MYHVELTIPYANSVLVPGVFRVEFSITELHGTSMYWGCTVTSYLFRVFSVFILLPRNYTELSCTERALCTSCLFRAFSVFNFLSRNYTELACTTCTRRYRIDSVCFPCLIFYYGIARNFRVITVNGNTLLVPVCFPC